MQRTCVFDLGVGKAFFYHLVEALDADRGALSLRSFPDGESHIRFDTDVAGCKAAIACSLDRPNPKLPPLLFAADTARDLGASEVGLIAPYLAYMRQDKRFRPGEGITARYHANLVSEHFDWLVTVDPHLHRFQALSEIYSIPTEVVHAAPLLADWIGTHVLNPVLIGPDSESEQWVSEVAARDNTPYLILHKERTGDRRVQISIPRLDAYRTCTPVLVDDIISTGQTLAATIEHLRREALSAPVCVAVHGVFADGAFAALRAAGSGRVVTCNTIEHASNAIDVAEPLAAAARRLLSGA